MQGLRVRPRTLQALRAQSQIAASVDVIRNEGHHRIDQAGARRGNDLKTLQELWKDVEGKTTIQINQSIGLEVEIRGTIRDIYSGIIFIVSEPVLPQNKAICIVHEPNQLEELLKYSPGNRVYLTARFKTLSPGSVKYFHLELLSISRSAA